MKNVVWIADDRLKEPQFCGLLTASGEHRVGLSLQTV